MSSKIPWPKQISQENSGHPELPVYPPNVTCHTRPQGPPLPIYEVFNTTTNSETIPETLPKTLALKLKPIVLPRRLPPPMSPEGIGADSPQVSEDSRDSDNSTIGAAPIAQDGVEAGGGDPEDVPTSVPQKIQLTVTPLRLGQILLEQGKEDVRMKVTETLSIPSNKRRLECLHEGCGKSYFGGKRNFKYHILDKHRGILPIQCPLCTTYSALTLPEIYNHFYNIHKQTMFICPFCDLHLPTTSKVSAHFKRFHGIWVGQNESNATFEESTQEGKVVQSSKAPENLEEIKDDKKRAREDPEKHTDGQMKVPEDSHESEKRTNFQNLVKRVIKLVEYENNDSEDEGEEEEEPELQIIKIVLAPGKDQVQDRSKELGEANDDKKRVVEDSKKIKGDQKRVLKDSDELPNVQNIEKRIKVVENESKNHPGAESEVEEMEEEPEVQIIKVVPPPGRNQVQDEPNDIEDPEASTIQELIEILEGEMEDADVLWI